MSVFDQLMRWRATLRSNKMLGDIIALDARLRELRAEHSVFSKLAEDHPRIANNLRMMELEANALVMKRERLASMVEKQERLASMMQKEAPEVTLTPKLGERILLLILTTREERANIPGDLEEEFKEVAAKHGARYAKLWYYKQVAASAWPLMRKAAGWGLLASLGAWLRRII